MEKDLILIEDYESEILKRYYLLNNASSIEYLPQVNQINIFVGANNSGKSWMMRHLMNMSDYKYVRYSALLYQVDRFNSILTKDINVKQRSDRWNSGFTAPTINIKIFERRDLIGIINISQINQKNFKNLFDFKYWEFFDAVLNKETFAILRDINLEILEILSQNKTLVNPEKYFIPTLRTAHSLYDSKGKKIEDDIFLNTLNKNYPSQNVKVFTGLHLYKSILNSRNARKEIRKRFEDFETFIQDNFFDGKKIDIVAEFDKDKSLSDDNSDEIISIHIDGENDTRKIYELGDGIQAIIILMYQIFMAEDNSVIFIDEPELNLHPGMQRLFFEQISLNKDLTKKKLTYFISTHSNHLLDLTLENDDVSIYSFNPIIENGNKKIIIKNVDFGNTELLRDLGVNNTSVFLANSSIWVEGISDRNYIKSFLKAYCDDVEGRVYPKEDIDFTFFEYAGGNIEHYILGEKFNDDEEKRFLEEINSLALSNKIFLLADSDMSKTGKKCSRLKSLEDKFSREGNFDGLIFWNIRESENLLPKQVWQKVLINFCNKNNIDEYTQDKINAFFENAELNRTEYVGKFLKKAKEFGIPLKEICEKKNRGVGEEWRTFKDKANLSRIILEKTLNKEITWENFKEVPEIVTLTKKIYQFIFKKEK
ncbi:AAA family ATPase [Chryseobacterium sp. CCH4-E10]|uniref:AAA family ATPase n=1 Tax=Chryseobacterium sp. CCH4-E10 TaxID=1768758 RepID=UPI0008357A5A|nr:AAA family ATPase [Chryseobacterium sp. CCH4-E10]